MRIHAFVLAASCLIAAPALAASPIDGTWKIDIGSAELSRKPHVVLLRDGAYECSTCTPVFKVKADGAFHPVAGMDYFDEASMTVVDAATVEEVDKLKGKIVARSRYSLSPDGKTQTIAWEDMTAPDGSVARGTSIQARLAPAPAGAHPISGRWESRKVAAASDAAITISYMLAGGTLSMKTADGFAFDAKLGGPAVPLRGDPAGAMVKARALPGGGVEITQMRKGAVESVLEVVPQDARTLKATSTGAKSGRVTRYLMRRQA